METSERNHSSASKSLRVKGQREIPLKQWRVEEAVRQKTTPHAISQRIYDGHYPHLKYRRVNKRVVFVVLP